MVITDDTGGTPRSPKKLSPGKITIKGPQPPPIPEHHHRNPPRPPSPPWLPPPSPPPPPPPQAPAVSYILADDEDEDEDDEDDEDDDQCYRYDVDEWLEDIGEDLPEDEEDRKAEMVLLEYEREWKESKLALAAKKLKGIEEVNRKWREETGKLGWRYSEPDEHGRRKMYFVDPNSNIEGGGDGDGDGNGDEDGKSNKDPPLP